MYRKPPFYNVKSKNVNFLIGKIPLKNKIKKTVFFSVFFGCFFNKKKKVFLLAKKIKMWYNKRVKKGC